MSAGAWVAVGLLGGIAAGARFLLDHELTRRTRGVFPVGILVVNLLGAVAVGFVAGVGLDGEALAIVAGGGIGSFTTFSTWILDTHRLERRGRPDLAALNLGVSVLAGFGAVVLGHAIGGL